MVAGAEHELGLRPEAAEIFVDDDALGAAVHQGGDIEVVAGHDDHVEAVGHIQHPVELRQRIVQIGNQEEAHDGADRVIRRT